MRKPIVLIVVTFILLGIKNMYAREKKNFEIICFGQIENFVLDYLKNNLSEIFNVEVLIGKTLDLPQYAYNKKRNQYLSTLILNELSKLKKDNHKILAIINKDLYVPELNFVFGEADPESGVCIISLVRLYQSSYGLEEDKDLFLKRALKEATHEMGHLFNLGHCPNLNCVMHFSNSLLDTDRKDYNFCGNCKKVLYLK